MQILLPWVVLSSMRKSKSEASGQADAAANKLCGCDCEYGPEETVHQTGDQEAPKS